MEWASSVFTRGERGGDEERGAKDELLEMRGLVRLWRRRAAGIATELGEVLCRQKRGVAFHVMDAGKDEVDFVAVHMDGERAGA
jgi:hypothetical protein